MRSVFLLVAALSVPFLTCAEVWGQAGRYVPIPVPRSPGGGFHVPIHLPGLGGESDILWLIVAVVAVIILAAIGWRLGRALGRRTSGRREASPVQQPARVAVPSLEDLILRPEEVEGKARRTGRLLAVLADHNAVFNPWALRAWIATLFSRVQQCWQERDYGPVRELLIPPLCAQHEELLHAMHRNGESNRIDDLSIRRLEFVHVSCPEEHAQHEVTALITFDAKVYFVSDRTGAFLRGSQKVIPYQEFWVFRRQGDAWRLQGIEQSHESDRLEAANHVAAMTDEALRNAEDGDLVVT